jgi:NAD(P)-dependent dehydrogenase (short-subunit alcohol dehydrogenase family)
MTQDNAPVWFITGCSTGFGREIARQVLGRGWRAVVTARNLEQVRDIVTGHKDNALGLSLDVTDKDAIARAVQSAEEEFGRIDVLVNNAGYGYLAAIEEGEDDEVRAMFETNVFGLIDLIKAVLPGMRRRKKGHIVNISSIGGLVSFAATGYYHATKYAVEGLSESLALEVAPLGIKVLIVEPGPSAPIGPAARSSFRRRGFPTMSQPPASAVRIPKRAVEIRPAIPCEASRQSSRPSRRKTHRCACCSGNQRSILPTKRWKH